MTIRLARILKGLERKILLHPSDLVVERMFLKDRNI